jgi:hypothetical protein
MIPKSGNRVSGQHALGLDREDHAQTRTQGVEAFQPEQILFHGPIQIGWLSPVSGQRQPFFVATSTPIILACRSSAIPKGVTPRRIGHHARKGAVHVVAL